MGLVIKTKGTKAPEGSEKLFRDPLVAPGTVLLQDFSNRGTLYDFRLQNGDPVYDLSREVSEPKGIINNTTFLHNSDTDPELTPGKGFRVDNLGDNPGSQLDLGINLGKSALEYLDDKSGVLLIMWVRQDPDGATGAFLTSEGDGGASGYPVRAILNASRNLVITLAGGTVASEDLSDGRLAQVGVEYRGSGIANLKYVNGEYVGEGPTLAGSFGTPITDLVLGMIDTIKRGAITYRWMIDVLSESGRTAEETVKKDWEYCNGIGEFAGKPTKRPFIDVM